VDELLHIESVFVLSLRGGHSQCCTPRRCL